MSQRLGLRLRRAPQWPTHYQQQDCIVEPKSPVDKQINYDFGDPQPVMFDAHGDNVVVGDHVWSSNPQGK